jgi:hypothetical protein
MTIIQCFKLLRICVYVATNSKFASLIRIFGKHPVRNLGTDISDLFMHSSSVPMLCILYSEPSLHLRHIFQITQAKYFSLLFRWEVKFKTLPTSFRSHLLSFTDCYVYSFLFLEFVSFCHLLSGICILHFHVFPSSSLFCKAFILQWFSFRE